MSLFLLGLAAACLPLSATGGICAHLSWTASSDARVAGYNIYYGGASHQYTNMIVVGNVTNAVIPSLDENTTYFFAAKAQDSAGNQSDFSNEAAFAGFAGTPNGSLKLKALLGSTNSDPIIYSLDASAPPGATINPTNGVICWAPGLAYASTTNYINVIVTDTANPALNTSETFQVVIGDYLSCQLGTTAVYAGQAGCLPLTLTSSSTVTNVQITVAWPGCSLLNPTLSLSAPIIASSIQNQTNQLVIQLQTDPNQPLTGTNQIALLNFEAAPGQTTTILDIPMTAVSGNAASGSAYANVQAQSGEVAVVGTQIILRPQADPVQGRTLSLYANPGTYELLYTTSLASPVSWTPLMTYQQTNAVQTVSLDSVNPVIFYRLQSL